MRFQNAFALGMLVLAATTALPRRADASGFFITDRGVRSMGRGGAFVAGTEGPESLWMNPAGLEGAGDSFRMEGTQTFMRGTFNRLDDGGGMGPTVDLKTAFLPIPLFGLTKDFGLRDWTFGAAFYAPNASVYDWPDNVKGNPAPQRYSLYSLRGSIFGNFALGAAWHGVKGLSIGVSAAVITGRFKASLALSACDGLICVNPEDPSFDAATVLTLKRFATVMVGAGITYETGPITFGASVQSPWTMQGKADVDVSLPSDPAFAQAEVDGSQARVEVPFAMVARGGIQYEPIDELRMEVALVWEGWSRQQSIDVQANDIYIRNVVGIGDYQVGSVNIERGMQNTYSIRGGLEYDFDAITFRGGASYDTSAFPNKTLTPMTLDGDKVVAGVGVRLNIGKVIAIDLVYGHVFIPDRKIRDSVIAQPNAIRPEQPAAEDRSIIGNGDYTMEADYVGIGSTFRF